MGWKKSGPINTYPTRKVEERSQREMYVPCLQGMGRNSWVYKTNVLAFFFASEEFSSKKSNIPHDMTCILSITCLVFSVCNIFATVFAYVGQPCYCFQLYRVVKPLLGFPKLQVHLPTMGTPLSFLGRRVMPTFRPERREKQA